MVKRIDDSIYVVGEIGIRAVYVIFDANIPPENVAVVLDSTQQRCYNFHQTST